MCEKFGKSPCADYLFEGFDSAHFKLAVDMTVYNIWADWREQEDKKIARRQKLKNASTK